MAGSQVLIREHIEVVNLCNWGKPQKKVLFLVAGPLRGGGGLNGCATKEKITFFLKALVAGPGSFYELKNERNIDNNGIFFFF